MAPTISDEKYVSLTTFRKDGTPKPLPVWVADIGDGKVGFTTAGSSYKVKRINNNRKVILQPSDNRGNVREGTEPIHGTATVVTGPEFERVKSLIKKKYGIQFTMAKIMGDIAKLMGKGSGTTAAVVITLD